MDAALRALNRFRPGGPRGRARAACPIHAAGCARSCAAVRHGWPPPAGRRRPRPSAMPCEACASWGAATTKQRRQARRRLVEIGAAELRHALTARVTSERPVRRAARRLLVEPPVRVDGRQGAGGAAGGQLRARGHPSARARTLRGHGAGVGPASGDAGLPRQLPVDWPRVAGRAARRGGARAVRGARQPGDRRSAAPRPERELRARAAGAAHARRERRLHAAGRAGAGAHADRLDDRRPRRRRCGRRAPGRRGRGVAGGGRAGGRRCPSGSSFARCCTSRATKTLLGHDATARPAWRKASAPSRRCARIRPRRSSSRGSW